MLKNLSEAVAATTDKTGKLWRIRIIESNVRGSSAYYPADVLERDGAKAFPKGTPMYINHPTADEKWNQPERDVTKLAGYLATEAQPEADGLWADAYIYADHREWLMERAEHIGLSIVARGEVEETADGPQLVSLTVGQSVDLVTKAGAGGKFVEVLESAKPNSATTSVADSPKKEEIMELPKELLEALDALVKTSAATASAVQALTEAKAKEDADKATAIAEAAKEAAPKAPTFAEIDKALNEAELPVSARATVLAAVEAGAVLAEAVAAKKAEVEALLAEVGTFKGFAADDKGVDFKEAAKTAVSGIYGN